MEVASRNDLRGFPQSLSEKHVFHSVGAAMCTWGIHSAATLFPEELERLKVCAAGEKKLSSTAPKPGP